MIISEDATAVPYGAFVDRSRVIMMDSNTQTLVLNPEVLVRTPIEIAIQVCIEKATSRLMRRLLGSQRSF
jgi:hypothetical protein